MHALHVAAICQAPGSLLTCHPICKTRFDTPLSRRCTIASQKHSQVQLLAVHSSYQIVSAFLQGVLQWKETCGGHVRNAACGRRFTLLNLRTDSKFVLITGGLGANLQAPNFTIIAQSSVITNTNVNQPTQVIQHSALISFPALRYHRLALDHGLKWNPCAVATTTVTEYCEYEAE